MATAASPSRSPNIQQRSVGSDIAHEEVRRSIPMADVDHGSPNSISNTCSNSSSSHNTPSDTATTTTGFNLNTHDYDGLLKGSTTSLTGITDGRDYVIGGDRHDEGGGGSGAAVGGGGGYYKAVSAASSSSANQLDMRNTGARGAAPTMTETVPTALLGSSGLAGPSGSSSAGNIGMPPPSPPPPAPSDVQVRKMILTGGMGSSVSEAKLRRFLEHNQRLKEQLDMPRIPVSEASRSLIHFVTGTRDPFLPMIWGHSGSDPFVKQSNKCCTIF
ncbi:MAG: GGL domain-containing protein [Benniella sp.]|nr:MAG: GGL domain-containing protein [Benniella sp.]